MMWLRRRAVSAVAVLIVALAAPAVARAAPHASVVMDMRSGEILYARNHDTRLHPASLTKMMTLYIAFEAIRNGEITLDTPVRISANAAGQPCVCLGVRAGQSIALRYLIRAAAVRSGNDAATAIGEAISGSESAFIARMNRTAQALGMTNTTFRNAHGLTAAGHLSTARDMTTLGRQLYFDFPEYYNLFSRQSANAGVTTVNNTNRAFLNSYAGADGIKTGFTRAAGFNLTASAERGSRRIIVTLFGGASVPDRTRRVTELMDIGFSRAPANSPIRRPAAPNYGDRPPAVMAMAAAQTGATAVRRSPLPPQRPAPVGRDITLADLEAGIAAALASATTAAPEPAERTAQAAAILPPGMTPPERPEVDIADLPFDVAEAAAPDGPAAAAEEVQRALAAVVPAPRPEDMAPQRSVTESISDAVASITAAGELAEDLPFDIAQSGTQSGAETGTPAETTPGAVPFDVWQPDGDADHSAPPQAAPGAIAVLAPEASSASSQPVPAPRAEPVPEANPLVVLTFNAAYDAPPPGLARLLDNGRAAPVTAQGASGQAPTEELVVSQISTSDARLWGVNIGRFGTRDGAERALMRAALAELSSFDSALRRVQRGSGGFEATFVGLSEAEARMACDRLVAHDRSCTPITP